MATLYLFPRTIRCINDSSSEVNKQTFLQQNEFNEAALLVGSGSVIVTELSLKYNAISNEALSRQFLCLDCSDISIFSVINWHLNAGVNIYSV